MAKMPKLLEEQKYKKELRALIAKEFVFFKMDFDAVVDSLGQYDVFDYLIKKKIPATKLARLISLLPLQLLQSQVMPTANLKKAIADEDMEFSERVLDASVTLFKLLKDRRSKQIFMSTNVGVEPTALESALLTVGALIRDVAGWNAYIAEQKKASFRFGTRGGQDRDLIVFLKNLNKDWSNELGGKHINLIEAVLNSEPVLDLTGSEGLTRGAIAKHIDRAKTGRSNRKKEKLRPKPKSKNR